MSDQKPSLSPFGDAIDRIGHDGEGLSVDVTAAKDEHPKVTAGGWIELGTRDQWGLGGAVQWAKDAWAAVGKVVWKPGGTK